MRVIALMAFFVPAAVSAWRMSELPLWGYWPMGLLLGVWGTSIVLFLHRLVKSVQDLRHLLLSTATGVLLWLGFPDMPFTPVLFIAFIPLLLVEDDLQRQFGRRSVFRMLFYAYHAFFLWNVLSTFWVANTAFVAGIFANVVNAGLMVLPLLGYHWLRHQTADRFRWISLVVFWLMFEYNHLHWELTWPFLSLGNALGQYPSWAQWYSLTGMLGGTVWFLAGNVLFFPAFSAWMAGKGFLPRTLLPGLAWFIVPLLVSLTMFHTYEPQGDRVEVAVVQPNFEPHYEKFSVPQRQQLDRFLELSRRVLGPETNYLVFPETSFGNFEWSELEYQESIRALRALLDSFPNCALITGVDPYRILKPGEESTARRPYVRMPGDTMWFDAANMAIQITPGQEVQQYVKGKLVPGAECTPYRWFFFFMEPLVDQLGGSMEGLRRSEERSVFLHQGKRVAPVICYESVFGEYCNGYIRKGGEAFAIITNDGWWDDTPGHRQHLKIGALRAIETRREIIRSANTGISCIIDQRGVPRQETRYGETTAFRSEAVFNKEMTFYTRWGDYLGRMGLFAAVFMVAYGLWMALKGRLGIKS